MERYHLFSSKTEDFPCHHLFKWCEAPNGFVTFLYKLNTVKNSQENNKKEDLILSEAS